MFVWAKCGRGDWGESMGVAEGRVGVDGDAEETVRVEVSRIYLRACTLKDFWQIWKECVFKSVSPLLE